MEGSNEETEFYVLEETRIGGKNYLLVTEDGEDEEEAEALILKDLSDESDPKRCMRLWKMKKNCGRSQKYLWK